MAKQSTLQNNTKRTTNNSNKPNATLTTRNNNKHGKPNNQRNTNNQLLQMEETTKRGQNTMNNNQEPTQIQEEQQRTKELKILFKKEQRFLHSIQTLTEFKEPIMFLMRNSGHVDFIENVKNNMHEYEHTDGNKRYILLSQKYIRTFNYGKKTFRGYICEENSPVPLPTDPILTSEQVSQAIDKTLNDIKKWKAQELKAQAKLYWTLGLIAMGLIALYIVYKMLAHPAETATTATTAVQVIKNNITQINPITI